MYRMARCTSPEPCISVETMVGFLPWDEAFPAHLRELRAPADCHREEKRRSDPLDLRIASSFLLAMTTQQRRDL